MSSSLNKLLKKGSKQGENKTRKNQNNNIFLSQRKWTNLLRSNSRRVACRHREDLRAQELIPRRASSASERLRSVEGGLEHGKGACLCSGIPPQMVVGLFWCPCKTIPNLKYRGSLDFPEAQVNQFSGGFPSNCHFWRFETLMEGVSDH